ncbi:MAG TPA: FGGY family carbohydrate kinase [Chitinophagaceae bacterium]|nr:FGGY family carbohydrate kinase [Chitinophagaceae bacterium]
MRRNNAAIESESRENSLKQLPVIAIFDIGKTNKKLLLFNEQYSVVYEDNAQLPEITDEDGFACEDVHALTRWILDSFEKISDGKKYTVRAVNFSAYGASFIHLDEAMQPCLPLYNYLKPYPEKLKQQFYDSYGGESLVAKQTASPVLGSLNSGMQLYRLKYEKPAKFEKIKYSIHLPQYASFVLSGKVCSDITSIGCHTNLWHFQKNAYHLWVQREGIEVKLPCIKRCDEISYTGQGGSVAAGIGLHDSSAALIPYLYCFSEPFVLLSTGTWCISLNPFNHDVLSDYELHNDCLCYLTYEGKPVKASRLFAGYEHEQQVKKLAAHFNKPAYYYTTVLYNPALKVEVEINKKRIAEDVMVQSSAFESRDLSSFANYEEAYHQLIADIITQQVKSTNLVLANTPVAKIFVDGGFSKNSVYMHMLAGAFSNIAVYAASVPQASALGAAMVLHKNWNAKSLPQDVVKLVRFNAV